MKYKQLTSEQRYTIQQCKAKGMSQTAIAELVGCHQSTISREIKRNSTEKKKSYSGSTAHMLAMERRKLTVNNKAKSKGFRRMVLNLVQEKQWSPAQISGYLKKNDRGSVSIETIYNWIRDDKKNGGKIYLNCRHQLKKRKNRIKGASASHIPNRVSIHQRPPEVDEKKEFGHFEMDTIVAKGGKKAIVTLVERTTKMIFMANLTRGFKPRALAKEVIRLLAPYKKWVKTITTDNGLEFRDHQYITQKLEAQVYFADPYASWQKGAIENANKLIRQYIKKDSDFNEVKPRDIQKIRQMLNQRPREKLDFETPLERFIKLTT